MEPHECFELLRPLYGLRDAADFWHLTLHKQLVSELCFEPTQADRSLHFSFRRGGLLGINGSYVDGLLRAGTPQFRHTRKQTQKLFETSGDEPFPFTFAAPYAVDQTFYIRKPESLCMTSS